MVYLWKKIHFIVKENWLGFSFIFSISKSSEAATIVFYFNAAFRFGRQIPQALEDRKY